MNLLDPYLFREDFQAVKEIQTTERSKEGQESVCVLSMWG